MCMRPMAMDDLHDGSSSKSSRRYAIGAADEAFVDAPCPGDPACFLQADAIPVRETIDGEVDAVRAAAGLPSTSAAMFRVRRANDHRSIAAEFVERRRASAWRGADGDDELCRGVKAAMDTGVIGSCAHCGCNFSVVAVVDVDTGKVCGRCRRPVRPYQPAPMVRLVAADAEERWKGWLPWQ